MTPKISIIVPIYNVEAYLGRCLESVLSQSLLEIEIIAVNDGSTDGSLNILNEYASKDERIVVIDQKNQGVSAARNAALPLVKGEYIGFVDPDDWIEREMYEAMYSSGVQKKADIVMCTYIREFGSHSKVKKFDLPDTITYCNEDVQYKIMRRLIGPLKEEVANPENLDAWGTVWSKIYRAELLKQNQLRFVDLQLIGSNEDSLFNIHAFYHAQSFVFLNRPYYHYWRANDRSVTTGYKPALTNQFLQLYDFIESFIEEKGLQQDCRQALNNRISLNTLGLGLNAISKGNQVSFSAKIKEIKTILHHRKLKRSLEHFETVYCPIVWRTFFFCAKSRFVVGIYVMLLAIEWLRKTVK